MIFPILSVISVPVWEDIIYTTGWNATDTDTNTSTMTTANSLVSDFLPWLATFLGLVIAVLLVRALYRKIIGGASKLKKR